VQDSDGVGGDPGSGGPWKWQTGIARCSISSWAVWMLQCCWCAKCHWVR